jgi:uncharacterized protein
MGIGRFVVFFLVISLLMLSSSFYVTRRAKKVFGIDKPIERVGIFAMIVVLAATILSRWLEMRILGQVAHTFVLAILITTGLLLIADLIKFVLTLPFRFLKRPDANSANPAETKLPEQEAMLAASTVASEKNTVESPAAPPSRESMPEKTLAPKTLPVESSRRVFLGQAVTGSAMVVGSGSSVYGAIFGRTDFSIEEVSVRIPGLSKRLDSYTLVQISDIHFGLFVGEKEIRQAEDLVRTARPDRLVLTGDLVDSHPRFAETLGQFIRRMTPLTRDGVVVIPGNHDWYAGVDIVMNAAKAAGAKVLRNDGFVIGDEKDGLAMLGVEDVWAKRTDPSQGPDLDKAISRVPADLPRVLLCHNPVYFPEAAGKVALQLSGHTHGGQINLGPMRPGDIVLPYGYVRGSYERNGSQLYVNRGFGTAGPPARIGSPPEITRVVLVSG